VQLASSVQTNVDTQTATVAIAQSIVESATITTTNAQTVLTTEIAKLPELQANVDSATTGFYTENSNLGTATSNLEIATTAANNAISANQVAENNLNNQTSITIATQEANAVARDANDTAQAVLVDATTAVTTQQAVVSTDTQAVQTAQAAAIASAAPGLDKTIYQDTGYNSMPPVGAGVIKVVTTDTNGINEQWGSGSPAAGVIADDFQVKWSGNIATPVDANVTFYAPADDGTKLYVDNTLIINDWYDKGGGGSQSAPVSFTANIPKPITLWFYENGGGANVILYWSVNGSGYVVVPASAFTRGTVDPALQAALDSAVGTLQVDQATLDTLIIAQNDAQIVADIALQTYVDANNEMMAQESIQATVQQDAWDTRAIVQSTQEVLSNAQTDYNSQLAVRDTAYQTWQDTIHAVDAQQSVIDTAQQNLTIAQQNLTIAQQNLTTEQQNLTNTNQNLTISLEAANSLANIAVEKVNIAIVAMQNATQVTTNYYAELKAAAAAKAAEEARLAALKAEQDRLAAEERARIAAEIAAKAEADRLAHEAEIAAQQAANEKAAAEAKAAEEARILAEQQAKEAEAAKAKAEEDARIQAEKDAQAKADAAKAEADRLAAEQAAKDKAAADAALAEQKAKDEAAKAAQEAANAKAEADKKAAEDAAKKAEADKKAAEDKAKEDAIGVKPNSPDQLSDTVVKEAPKEVLVPHIQQDKPGVENGGIEFFGTKSAPQVVGEDGKLTPPAPPPGSGLPIPPDAITTQDTFIGQPGGTTFNAPDVAVPVIMTYVCHTIQKDGKDIHIDIDGNEHQIEQCTFLPAALDAIPGAGQAVQAVGAAYTAMANIGNDMSPVTRKKAKKILVLTVAVAAIRRRFGS
jgi:hypothetical protein